MKIKSVICVGITALVLTGCGHDPGERALTGAGIGAGAGAVGGALLGSPITGAVIGGAAGAATGAATSPNQIDLNRR